MSDDPRDFPTVSTRDGYSRYAYSWEIDAMEEEERLRQEEAAYGALVDAVYRVLREGFWGTTGRWICSPQARVALGDAWNGLPDAVRPDAS